MKKFKTDVPRLSRLLQEQIERKMCGGTYKKRTGGPVEPPGVSAKRRPGSKTFSSMSDQELIGLTNRLREQSRQAQAEMSSLQERTGRKGKSKPGLLDKLTYTAENLLFGDSVNEDWDELQFKKNRVTQNSIPINPEDYILPVAAPRESTNVAQLLELKRNGGIHIKKSKRGTFTAAATKHGKGVQEFARQVLANKENYSPAMVKKANFARNASKWKKEFGGDLGGFLQNISPLVSVIPGAGAPIGAGMSILGSILGRASVDDKALYPLNQMKLGGDFKQYNAPGHENGGQLIDGNGNPTTNSPVAEIEKKENSYDGYVFSDTLRNPDTGNTFAKDAKKVAMKTKGKDQISQSSRVLQLMKLKMKNEGARMEQQAVNSQGIPMAENGIPYKDAVNPMDTLDLGVPGITPGILPIFNQLPSIGGVTGSPRPMEYPYDIRETDLASMFRTVETTPDVPDNVAGTVSETAKVPVLNKIAAGLKGAALGYGAIDALRRSEREKLQLPDYSKGDQYYRGLEMDFAPQLAEINMAATKATSDVSSQAGGIGARNARVASILSRAGKNAAQTQLQQQSANNQIRAMLGQREDQKAQVSAAERIRQQTAQSQNDAQARLAERKFFSDLSQVGTTLNNIQYANDMMKNQNELGRQAMQYGLAILSQKYPNFKPSDDFMQRLQSGTLTEADKPMLDQLIQFIKSGS